MSQPFTSTNLYQPNETKQNKEQVDSGWHDWRIRLLSYLFSAHLRITLEGGGGRAMRASVTVLKLSKDPNTEEM